MPAPKHANISHTPPGRNARPSASASSRWPRPRHSEPCSARLRSGEPQPSAGAPAPWLHENTTPGAGRRLDQAIDRARRVLVLDRGDLAGGELPGVALLLGVGDAGPHQQPVAELGGGVPSRAVKYTARAGARAGARSLRTSLSTYAS